MNKKKILIIGCSIVVVISAIIIFFLISNKKSLSYEITFETNGGTLVESQIVNETLIIKSDS